MDILSSGPYGLTNWWWSGDKGDWQPAQNPDAMATVDSYTELATNMDKHVYAMQDGQVKEFTVTDDGQSWSEVGLVVTG